MLKLALPILFKVRPAMVYEMIRKQMAGSVPFAAHAGVELVSIGDGRAEALLPDRPEVKNHIGSQHAAALFTLGETASGAAMAGAMAPVLLSVRPVAATARIGYAKIAKGPIRGLARVDADSAALRATLEAEGKVRFDVAVDLVDEGGETVATMAVEWHVSKKRG